MVIGFIKHCGRGIALGVALGMGGLGVQAQATPVATPATPWLSTFGKGAVEIRLYTDFFCNPCRAEESEVAALLAQIVDRQAARVTFVDYPGHQDSSLYAVYFLAALNAKGGGDIHLALALRAAFYEAAAAQVSGQAALEQYLSGKGIPHRPLDYRPTFKLFEKWILEDKVLETPRCTIIGARDRESISGKSRILKALQGLAQGK